MSTCTACQVDLAPAARYCHACGERQGAPATAETRPRARRGYRSIQASGSWMNGAVALYVAGGLSIGGALVSWFVLTGQLHEAARLGGYANRDGMALVNAMLIVQLAVGVIYLGLGVWAKTQAFSAILIGLALLVVQQLQILAIAPAALFSGLLFKVVVVTALAQGLRASLKQLQQNDAWAGADVAPQAAAAPQVAAASQAAAQPGAAAKPSPATAPPTADTAMQDEAEAALGELIASQAWSGAVSLYRTMRAHHLAWQLDPRRLEVLAKGLWAARQGRAASDCALDLLAQVPVHADARIIVIAQAVEEQQAASAREHLAAIDRQRLQARQRQQVTVLEQMLATLEAERPTVEFA